MDIIIYLYQKRDLKQPLIQSFPYGDDLLVKAGLDVGEGRWFSCALSEKGDAGRKRNKQASGYEAGKPFSRNARIFLPLWSRLKERLETRKKKREERRLEKRRAQEFDKVQKQAAVQIADFLKQLSETVDERYECRFVYTDDVRAALSPVNESENGSANGSGWLPELWRRYWHFPEFEEYQSPRWMKPLLAYAEGCHFVALGMAAGATAVVSACAAHMKSLRWILRAGEADQDFLDFLDDFYEENGLAVAVQTLEGQKVYARLLLETAQPVCVLDFTQEPVIPATGLAGGSVWIDFGSLEKKGRRIAAYRPDISYRSLKESWKQTGQNLTPQGKMSIIR